LDDELIYEGNYLDGEKVDNDKVLNFDSDSD